MKPNAFIGQTRQPTERQLAEALGPAKAAWDALLKTAAEEYSLTREWKSYSVKMGWALRLKRKERNIVHLGPYRNSFQVLIIFGDKAMTVVREAKWPQRIRKILDEAPRYPEGTGVRLEIKKPKDIEMVKQLAAIKLAC
jgi:hypothetical protein